MVEEHLEDNLPVAREEKLRVEWRLMVSGETYEDDPLDGRSPLRDSVSSLKEMVSEERRFEVEDLRDSSGEQGKW